MSSSWVDVPIFYILLFGFVETRFSNGSDSECASNFVHILDECDRDSYNDETSVWGRMHEAYTESSNSLSPRKSRQVKIKVKSMLIFFDIKGIVHKEFVLADQAINPTYYCVVLCLLHENLPRLCSQTLIKELAVAS
jgi:hypothetical protein